LIKFFLSNSEDLVDPNYNFLTDKHLPDRDRWRDDVYAHQIYDEPICDGIFLSGVPTSAISRRVEAAGSVQAFLHLPPNFPVMGDCGAFGYMKKDAPPYKTGDVLAIYQRHNYTYGASVDHLVDPKSSPAERQRRWDITLQNAQEFISEYCAGQFTFIPVGVAQGWDPSSYRQAVRKLVKSGYKYVAIGGVTRLHINHLKPILEEVSAVLPANVDLHLLGIARLSDLPLFRRLGVTSLNGSTPVKQATMGEYWVPGKKKYEAIRVPLALSGKLCHPEKPENETSDSETNHVKLEQTCLSLLRAYDRDEVSIDQVLKTVLRYNRLKGDTTDRRAKYEQTLQDRPWRSCPCKICRDIGIEVIIFRGNDRNRRRGFHNTWVFYRQLQTALAADS